MSPGVWITPAFPKLIYVLEEDNVKKGTEYYYLTGDGCQMYRQAPLFPDYISEKKMMELKEGNCFPCHDAAAPSKPGRMKNGNYQFYGRNQAW